MPSQRVISIKLPDRLLARIDRYASRRLTSRSQVIRDAILWLLARENALGEAAA